MNKENNTTAAIDLDVLQTEMDKTLAELKALLESRGCANVY